MISWAPEMKWWWYYEGTVAGYNVLLESTAWDLSSTMVPIENINDLCSLLALDETHTSWKRII